jgi:uncharacterized protein (DUF4213/DUF364 family)
MSILEELISSLKDDAGVRSVLVGAHWTVVCSRRCGLASTLMDGHPHGHSHVREVGRLHLKSALELAEFATSDNLLEASIGFAAINSLLEVDASQTIEGGAAQVLAERGRGKTVALVGHFPFIPELKEGVGRLWVIEQNPVEGEYPAEAAAELIPKADVVALTGTTLINQTFDGLMALCRPDAQVAVLGPSTPLSPILFDHGVRIIFGALVQDEEVVLRAVSQGANFRQLHQQGVRLVTIEKGR